jgi:hypothetical protein
MIETPSWELMKQHAFESFKSNGCLETHELEQIIKIGCEDGQFDDHEKSTLINIISNTTRADLNDDMWAKVADMIHKFELEDDRDAVIEVLLDEPDQSLVF